MRDRSVIGIESRRLLGPEREFMRDAELGGDKSVSCPCSKTGEFAVDMGGEMVMMGAGAVKGLFLPARKVELG
jgi:hypothetical protein